MKTAEQVREEIDALKRLGEQYSDDAIAQASIEGQIEVLKWVTDFSGASQ